MGIRPEHIAVDPAGTLCGGIEFIEDTGSDRYVHVTLEGGERFVVRVSPGLSLSLGDAVTLTVDPGKVHIFPVD